MRLACPTAFVLLSAVAVAGCQRNDAAPAAPAPVASTGTAPTASAPVAPSVHPVAKGEAAPPFSLLGSDGKTHALADHAGKQAVVLAWFPKAFTGG